MKMVLTRICSLFLVIGMTKAGIVPLNNIRNAVVDEKVHFDVNVAGQLTEENIEMNYEENYVRVTTPALGNVHAMVLIHDYTKDLTLFKVDGRCFMLSEYADVPQRMEDWNNLNFNMEGGVVQAGDHEGYRLHNYKIASFALNRTVLPEVMQRECESMDLMILEGTITGEAAYKQVETDEDCDPAGAIYLPAVREENKELNALKRLPRRNKRAARRNWCFICLICIFK